MFSVHDMVLIYFRESNDYFLNSRIFIEEKCIDWCFFKSALKIFSQVKDFVYITQFSKSAMASSSWILKRANLIFKLFILSDFYRTISTMWVKFKYESRRLGQASFTNGVVGQKVRSVTLKNVENFQSSLCFGSAIILEKKKDIYEDILDDIDIKVESKKFDEKISPPPSLLVVQEWQIWP